MASGVDHHQSVELRGARPEDLLGLSVLKIGLLDFVGFRTGAEHVHIRLVGRSDVHDRHLLKCRHCVIEFFLVGQGKNL
jgi:hypothetical protein